MDQDEDESDLCASNSSSMALVETMRRVIHAPVSVVFSDLGTPTAEETLRTFMEYLLRRSATLITVLAPPDGAGAQYQSLQREYTAFTTWLFGSLFYVVGAQMSEELMSLSVGVQGYMLRVLANHNPGTFDTLASEYMNILEDLLTFEEDNTNADRIIVSRFIAENGLIKDLDLKPFPVTIKRSGIPSTEIQIVKVILDIGVAPWNQSNLSNKVLKLLINGLPEVKIAALEVATQIIEFCIVDDKLLKQIIDCGAEIVQSIPSWESSGLLSLGSVLRLADGLKKLIETVPIYVDAAELSFKILEWIVHSSKGSNSLGNVACNRIIQHLKETRRTCPTHDVRKYINYYVLWPPSINVLQEFILNDLKNHQSNSPVIMGEVSRIWSELRAMFIMKLDREQFNDTLCIANCSSWLDTKLANEKIQARFYDAKLGEILTLILKKLNTAYSDPIQNMQALFKNVVCLTGHREAQDERLQKILALPWASDGSQSLGVDRNVIALAKSMDVMTKRKCLDALCGFGNGKWRLSLLKACVIGCDIELAVASIQNSVLLMEDIRINPTEIIADVLQPALVSRKQKLLEALADVLGNIVCLLSGKATVIRETSDPGVTQWVTKCAHCNEGESLEPLNTRSMLADNEKILSSYFELLTSTFVEVRLGMSKNFIQFVNHTQLFISNRIAEKWLPYIQEPNAEIRTNVARVVGIALKNKIISEQQSGTFSEDDPSSDLEEFFDMAIDIMADTFTNAVELPDPDLHKTLLITAKELACVPLLLVERPMLSIFLVTILHPNSISLTISAATAAFREVAAFYGITPHQMYIRYRTDFIKLMMEYVVYNCVDYSYNLATSLHLVAKCVGFEGSRQLLLKEGHIAICFLLSNVVRTPQAKNLLADMADLITQDTKDMFIDFFQYICPHVYINEDEKSGPECFEIVTSFTNTTISELMSSSFMNIFSKLLLHFHEHTTRVVRSLEILSKYDDEFEGAFDTREHVASYLQPRLHGVLVKLDGYLSPRFDESIQKSTLASLTFLMRFMGPKHLTPLRYKLLATLRTSLSFERPGFKPMVCEAWDAFIDNICVEDLGPLLPTIFVSTMQLMDSCPEKTNAMLEFLIIENNKAVADNISELFFIDDMKVSKKISSIIKKHIEDARTDSTEENLKLWLKRVINETDEVRLRALQHLQKFLANHRIELNGMILSDADVHPLIVELLDTLLAGCRDKDENIRLAYGECLGELGAIEPSLLPRRIVSRDESKFIFDLNEEFACAVLIELVRAFQIQKSTQSMDAFSLAIQDTLKTYDISPRGRNSNLWDELPVTTQQMIFPFLTSHYKFTVISDDNVFPHPIYGSEAGSTFGTWAYNWVLSMSRWIQDKTYRNVIKAFRPALRQDTRTLIFCIPHIVSYIVANGTENDRSNLAEEILAVINVTEELTIDEELDEKLPLRYPLNPTSSHTRISDEAKRVRCSQVVFSILDHLQRWLRERRLTQDDKYHAIQCFCNKFDSLVLAKGCYQSHEYHRALIYLEQHMASSNKGLAESTEGGLLAKIYAQLEEPDGVSGILATQDQSPTIQQLVLAHEVSGQLQDAATCYERLAQDKVKPKYLQGMVQCYLGLDQPFTAMNITEGVLNNRPELEPLIVEHECFWRLANFSQLNDTKQITVKRSLLDDLQSGRKPDLQSVKKRLVSLLGTASLEGAYQHSYPHIMKLHILNEFEKAVSIILSNSENLTTIFEEWEKRGQLVRASRGVESVLSMRRATLDLAVQFQREKSNTENPVLNEEIGKIWLKSAKIARKAGLYQQAYMYILSASNTCPPQELYIEQAQLYWQKGCQEDAFTTLKRSFTNCFQPSAHYKQLSFDVLTVERKQCAKAKLLFAKYNHDTLNVDTDGNFANFKEAIEVWRVWEKSLLACAQYYETVVDRMCNEDRDIKEGRDLQVHMMNYYGKSLQFGCKYIHQSMPRMLTIWLDFASRLQGGNSSTTKIRMDCLSKMTRIMDVYLERLPTFMWLTAFSQLVSRICHPCKEVQNTLCAILVKLILAYPQHCLWMMASVIKSSYPARQKRCQEIFNNPKLKCREITILIRDFNRLWERLIELSNKPIAEGIANTKVVSLSRFLPKLLENPEFSKIMMPTSKFRQLHLPSKGDSTTNWDPFPMHWAHITGIEESVTVMASLQRPRRITLRGSDGRKYLFMCKPKDDLRRDFRLMEFNDIVNKYLQKDPESRQRRLYIRTYGVVPLNEECGLIEWVPNLVGFRPIVMGIYKERKIQMSSRELKSMMCNITDPLEKKRQVFLEKLLPRCPPVLGDWFRLSFPDPYGWYEARTAYIRTTAVMSMVGYILGLGDRHGENILFDSKCGDCVHVDFNCLFNQGELFNWPEQVPFRLTHNMVEAMGPLKYEGLFRRSCQTTMRVLREQTATLLSVLTPFVYDPLVSWNKNQPEAGEKTNEKAVESIKNIQQRLKGMVRSPGKKLENIALNLSVEGQTNHLILEATSVDNLCQMYVGWGPYL